MPAEVIDPVLSADVMNEIADMATVHYEETVKMLMSNLFQGGLFAGQKEIENKMERLSVLMLEHDRNLTVATDMEASPGDAKMHQQALFEEQTLKQELFNATQ